MKQKQESARDWIEDSERQKNIEPILQEAKGRGRREIALKETDHNVPSMMADINISILQRSTEQDGEEDGRGDNKAHVAMWALLSEYSESLRRQNAMFAPDYQPITWQRLCNLACRRGEDDLQKLNWTLELGKKRDFTDFSMWLVPVGLVWPFQKLLINWDFHSQPSLVKKETVPWITTDIKSVWIPTLNTQHIQCWDCLLVSCY